MVRGVEASAMMDSDGDHLFANRQQFIISSDMILTRFHIERRDAGQEYLPSNLLKATKFD